MVVVAAGAWSSAIVREVGLEAPLRPTQRHLLEVRSPVRPDGRTPIVWDDASAAYLRPCGDAWVFCTCDTVAADLASPYDVDERTAEAAMSRLGSFAPTVARGARLARAWAGLRDLTPDDRPLLGPDPRLPGLSWCAGLGGHGLTISLSIGAHAASAVLGRPTRLAEACRIGRLLR